MICQVNGWKSLFNSLLKNQIRLLTTIIAFSLCAQLLLVPGLFIKNDVFYLGILPGFALPLPLKQFFYASIIICLLTLGFVNQTFQKILFAICLVMICIVGINNICLFQIWLLFQFSLLLILLYPCKEEDKMWCLRIMIICMYAYSGLSKFNIHFGNRFCSIFFDVRYQYFTPLAMLAYAAAGLEMLSGLGLYFKKSRWISKVFLTLMHVWILFNLKGNTVVYPWNVEMILLLWVIFPYEREESIFKLNLKSTPILFTIMFFVVHPAFQLLGLGIFPVTFNLYSFNDSYSYIEFSQSGMKCIPFQFKHLVTGTGADKKMSLNRLLYKEYNVPSYPGERVYFMIKEQLCPCLSDHKGKLVLVERPKLSLVRQKLEYSCGIISEKE